MSNTLSGTPSSADPSGPTTAASAESRAASREDPGRHPVILFDGVCNLCSGSVRFIIKRDRAARFRFASLQSSAGEELQRRVGLEPGQIDSIVLVEGERAFLRSDAALRIARRLDGAWKLALVFFVVPRPIRDWIYRWVARNRYRWVGKREECWLPTPELRRRFLDG